MKNRHKPYQKKFQENKQPLIEVSIPSLGKEIETIVVKHIGEASSSLATELAEFADGIFGPQGLDLNDANQKNSWIL